MHRPARILLVSLLLVAMAGILWVLASNGQPGTSANDPDSGSTLPVTPDRAEEAAPEAASPIRVGDTVRTPIETEGIWVVRGRTLLRNEELRGDLHLHLSLHEGAEAAGDPIAEVRIASDPEGGFRWPLPAPTRTVSIRARPEEPGYGGNGATAVAEVGDPAPQDLEVAFYPTDFRITGVVRTHEGVAMSGATVGTRWSAVETDEEGRYEIFLIDRGGSSFLYATGRGYERQRRTVRKSEDGAGATADFSLRPEFRIEGRILDEQGQPVLDASVQTFYSMAFPVLSTTDGQYALEHLDPSVDRHSLYARKPGFAEARTEVYGRSGAIVRQDLVLKRGVQVAGQVLDEAGSPVAGAKLYIGFSPNAYNRLDAKADAEGRFLFPAVPRETHTLVTQADGHAPDKRSLDLAGALDQPLPLSIVLHPGAHAAGIVVDDAGQPLPAVHVLAYHLRESLRTRVQTDAHGRFRLEGLPTEDLSLELFHDRMIRSRVELAPGSHDELVLPMKPHGFLAGRVVDGISGEAVPRFTIRFYFPQLEDGRRRAGGWRGSWSDEGHHFVSLDGCWDSGDEALEAGTWVGVEAVAPGYGITRMGAVEVRSDPDPDALLIAMFPAQGLRGRVLAFADSAPVVGARVQCLPADVPPRVGGGRRPDRQALITSSGADGSFSFESVAPGPTMIFVEHADWAAQVDGPFEVFPGVAIPDREVRLAAGGDIRGIVRDPLGSPVPHAEIELFGRALAGFDSYVRATTSDTAGHFLFAHLPAGDYGVRHQERDGPYRAALAALSCRLSADEVLEIELRPPGDASVEGVIVATAEIGAVIQVSAITVLAGTAPGDQEVLRIGTLARQGAFTLRGLSAGSWTLSARSGSLSGNLEVVLAPGQQATVQLRLE